jgi:hypothetical protein
MAAKSKQQNVYHREHDGRNAGKWTTSTNVLTPCSVPPLTLMKLALPTSFKPYARIRHTNSTKPREYPDAIHTSAATSGVSNIKETSISH